MRRSVIAERMDTDQGTPQEIESSLADLRFINRWFGGVSTTRSMLRKVARRCGCDALSLLDVGSGSGDIPLKVAAELRAQGIVMSVTLLDAAPTHLPSEPGAPHRVAASAL